MTNHPLTREHVVWAYRILLDRDPENEAVILPKQKAYVSTRELRADIMSSREFREKNRDHAHTNQRTVVIAFLDGSTRLFIDLSDHAIGLNILRGRYERNEVEFIRRTVRPGQNVLDVGAHIGFFTMHLAALVGPGGSVHAFEPMQENADLLNRSIAENGFGDRVQVVRAAVTATDGSLKVAFATETLNSGGAFVVQAGGPEGLATRRVPAVTLDRQPLRRPVSFVKLDVEGAEPLVLEGARKLLEEDRPVLLSEIHPEQLARVSQRTVEEFLAGIRSLGYRAYSLEGDGAGRELTSAPPGTVSSIVMVPGQAPERAVIAG